MQRQSYFYSKQYDILLVQHTCYILYKRKHKKSCWMTYGILESINNKNKLYKRFIQTDKNNIEHFNTLKNEYHIYRARLRRTI